MTREEEVMRQVDDVDLRLIRCLQDNPRAPYSTIARLMGVSETTVKRRLDVLMKERIITTAVFPNPRRLGYHVHAQIGLKTALDQMEAVALRLRDLPEVAFVSLAVGRYDVLAYVLLPSMDELTRFISQRIAVIPGVRESETIITPKVYKAFANWRVPIDGLLRNGVQDGSDVDEHAENMVDVF